MGKDRALNGIQFQMLSRHPKPPPRHISDSSDPRPSKRAKTATVEKPEATGSRAKAERWFNDTNNNASGTKDALYLDSESPMQTLICRNLTHPLLDDPPFYLTAETCSGGESACAVHSDGSSFNHSNPGQPRAPTRSLLAQMESSERNSEDFRGVIDDLTIQNKRLRKKLKRYERLHCSHLQEEKLFEVKIHGLGPNKKRELEEMLRNFASSIEESPEMSLFNLGNFKASAPALANHKPSSSSTSYSKGSKVIDSAYASMSGQTGVSQMQSQDHSQQDRQVQSHSRQQNVKSYLHDIPETLVPKHSLVMSERAKSRLVVRRLEQIFTGRRAAGRHNQSHQQQEVSQSAAHADRIRLETPGRKFQSIREGVREARILPNKAKLKVDSLSEANLAAQQSQQTVANRGRKPMNEGMREARILLGSQIDSSSETHITGQRSRVSTDGEDSKSRDPRASGRLTPDQRPTRPLDLDIHRPQVPSDNLEYIRHLGLASPTATLNVNPDSDDGWVFLNLLTGMAQLHTLNVTPEFIRHAVADVSSKLELSTDGTKVRWQGGTDGTKMSSDSDESDDRGNWEFADTGVSVGKLGSVAGIPSRAGPGDFQEPKRALAVPTIGLPAAPEVGAKRRPVYLEQPNDVDKFQYKPLFFHGATSEDDDDSALATKSASSFDPMENATGLNSGSHDIRESEVKLCKQNRETGPIIFYNKARFCTDLSGDSSGAMHDEAAYCRYTQEPIGCLQHANGDKLNESESEYVPDGDGVTESTDLDIGGTLTIGSTLDLEDLKSSISDFSTTSPIPMEVSGLGGIQPEDNFIVKVQVRHGRMKRRGSRAQSLFSSPRSQIRRLLHSIPRGSIHRFREANDIPRSQPDHGLFKNEIISTVRTDMPPSSLPPPSYACLPFSSSESGDGDEDLSVNHHSEKPQASPKSSVVEDLVDPRHANFFLGSSSNESSGSSYISTLSGSDDDSSIDFLANARVLDPDTIAAQEREFEINSVQQPARTFSVAAADSQSTSSGSEPTRIAQTESDVDSMSVDGDAEDD
ncbi:MAG: hypothetical protein ASARMPREDX12_000611 [Alectoria sarmentosa]|nr:MAG: hypothetical protein ASARMPREDX12_000611 [Alectoria sarmentosa]